MRHARNDQSEQPDDEERAQLREAGVWGATPTYRAVARVASWPEGTRTTQLRGARRPRPCAVAP
eukprot:8302268-Alexandrium_andersonii.AAC.1